MSEVNILPLTLESLKTKEGVLIAYLAAVMHDGGKKVRLHVPAILWLMENDYELVQEIEQGTITFAVRKRAPHPTVSPAGLLSIDNSEREPERN